MGRTTTTTCDVCGKTCGVGDEEHQAANNGGWWEIGFNLYTFPAPAAAQPKGGTFDACIGCIQAHPLPVLVAAAIERRTLR